MKVAWRLNGLVCSYNLELKLLFDMQESRTDCSFIKVILHLKASRVDRE